MTAAGNRATVTAARAPPPAAVAPTAPRAAWAPRSSRPGDAALARGVWRRTHDDAECVLVTASGGANAASPSPTTSRPPSIFEVIRTRGRAASSTRGSRDGDHGGDRSTTGGAATLHFTSDAWGGAAASPSPTRTGIPEGPTRTAPKAIRTDCAASEPRAEPAVRGARESLAMQSDGAVPLADCSWTPPPAAAASSSMRSTSRASRLGPTALTT